MTDATHAAKLVRLDPTTGEVLERPFDIATYLAGLDDAALERQKQLALAYDRAVAALIGENDVQKEGNRTFKKKSAWRKLGRHFGISTTVVVFEGRPAHVTRMEDGILVASVCVRASAPWGQACEAVGACATDEEAGRRRITVADAVATAQTRATNRAVSDLIAMGEVSAEEMQKDGVESVAEPVEATDKQWDLVDKLCRSSHLTDEQKQYVAGVRERRGGPDALTKDGAGQLIPKLTKAIDRARQAEKDEAGLGSGKGSASGKGKGKGKGKKGGGKASKAHGDEDPPPPEDPSGESTGGSAPPASGPSGSSSGMSAPGGSATSPTSPTSSSTDDAAKAREVDDLERMLADPQLPAATRKVWATTLEDMKRKWDETTLEDLRAVRKEVQKQRLKAHERGEK